MILSTALGIVVGTTFALACTAKLANPRPLAVVLATALPIRLRTATVLVRFVAVFEAAIVLGLVVAETNRAAMWMGFACSVTFLSGGVLIARSRGRGLECGCFGSLGTRLEIGRTQTSAATLLSLATLGGVLSVRTASPNGAVLSVGVMVCAIVIGGYSSTKQVLDARMSSESAK